MDQWSLKSKTFLPEGRQTVETGKAEQEHCWTEVGAEELVDAHCGVAAIFVASQYAAWKERDGKFRLESASCNWLIAINYVRISPTSQRFVVELKASALVVHRGDRAHSHDELLFRLLVVSSDFDTEMQGVLVLTLVVGAAGIAMNSP